MSTAPNSPRRPFRASAWWLAAAAFVLGIALGAVIVGLVSEGSGNKSTASPGAATEASTSTVPSDPGSSTAASGQITVNQACLDAVTGAQAAYSAINDIGDAARDLNASRLDEIVRSLQPLQAALSDNVGACNVTATLPNDAASTETATSGPSSNPPSSDAPTG